MNIIRGLNNEIINVDRINYITVMKNSECKNEYAVSAIINYEVIELQIFTNESLANKYLDELHLKLEN